MVGVFDYHMNYVECEVDKVPESERAAKPKPVVEETK